MSSASLTIGQAHARLKAGELTAVELARACIERIESVDKSLNAVVHRNFDRALDEAKKTDKKGAFDHPLAGIPYLAKDVFCEEGVPTTACSNILRNPAADPSDRGRARDFIPPFDSTTTKRLKAQSAVSLGKTNTDEFTMGASTETSCFGVTKNPWDHSRVAGGSSGGSAAAVAADECLFALGTDTGGSIRQPAGFCGCTGLKVTYGRTSRYGVLSMASSLDSIGALTKTVEDAAIVLSAIAGRDPLDATTGDVPVPDYTQTIKQGVKGMKIGLPKEYFIKGMDPQVEAAVREAAKVYASLGAKIVDVSLPHSPYAIATYYVIVPSEVSSNMARYDGVRFGHTVPERENLIGYYERVRSSGFGDEVKRRIMIGTYALSAGYYDAYYRQAQRVRTLIKRDFDQVFEKVDCLLTPVAPTPAFTIGAHTDDPVQMYLEDIFTVSINLAGIPGLSIPCGFAKAKPSSEAPKGAKEDDLLPIGMQILGPQWGEETILRAGHAYEQATEWHGRRPTLV
ncbi:MAG TPA: Asp-tRNA(Asn)/Glu-tRNA(Gln) amidotransferase GatCAB subunit A [Candidatus Peribacter riflensis]|uniref:Glutamyl-tRNA(Gln) amidotransferase subunit A n=1 Tax=Candidatus Peribacter riflensis TaxID=1735162 RepID=A0A0S1SYI7_9BACT|nr:MAG: aspartyl/glutamyl-tRNA amidotransferase subunit A [Candidatus Peribacter riflensis]OGJ77915.1 MAG: aspartyl/glutamyl-tRNA amidotransferase subunit A [Candidatus Peribacteria bacterium RIFOXYB1_FULL_57_12]OGJ79744.1 MAG: aspartyl/glutamyl-tRNA amidotransferase subunit A [Candidatus Peribacteria bacterium RIFOXYC1_FULL_58_8]ALM11574.1 MAG: aspartyl/glutamyl-tRNA amidotransferase subunit A [Candidatus Peribacter riflensis]ALM12676.1 MAG: aspartyl/glutamyl-tRNA amidotransferase subunit A /g